MGASYLPLTGEILMDDTITAPRASALLSVPLWKLRRMLDRFESEGTTVPRHGPYRVITPVLLQRLKKELGLQAEEETGPGEN
jgi:hypothetical protein